VQLGFGVLVALGLLARGGPAALLAEVVTATLAYALAARALGDRPGPWAWRAALVADYAFALWAYRGVERFVPALGLPLRDDALLALDESLLGRTPAEALQAWASPTLSELLSGCYLAYQLYLHAALLWALRGSAEQARALAVRVFVALPLGYLGYLLVPALGPGAAFPARFGPLPEGGPLWAANAAMVARGGAVYDAFPSLHVGLTLVLLAYDRRAHPARFGLLLPVALGLTLSTVYLRYHYAVDLLAGALLAGLVTLSAAPRPLPGTTPSALAPPG
jgi:membrane-associated phospholipid phosphatase